MPRSPKSLRLATLTLLASFSGVVPLSPAPRAHADTLSAVRVEQTNGDVRVHVSGELALPRVRIEPGQVRLWFDDVPDVPRVDERYREGMVRALRVRPGVEESAVVTLDLRDRRRTLPLESVLSGNSGDGILVRITPAAPSESESTPSPEAQESGETALAENDTDAAEESELAQEASAGRDTANTTGSDADDARTGAPSLALTGYEGPSLPYGLIGLLSLLLLAAHLLVRHLGKQRKTRLRAPEIDVVTTRRLGPRHQLMVVRALGEEHLISVHGNQTTLLATAAMQDALGDETGAERGGIVGLVEREATAKITHAMSSLGSSFGGSTSGGAKPASRRRGTESEDELAERFGAKLLKLAGKRREVRVEGEGDANPGRRDHGDHPNASDAGRGERSPLRPRRPRLEGDEDAATSEAIAGLLRLRASRED